MPADWYYQYGDARVGPLTPDQLRESARHGRLKRDTLVQRGPAGNWLPAHRLKGLFESTKADAALIREAGIDDAPPVLVEPIAAQKVAPMAYAALFSSVPIILAPYLFLFPLAFGFLALNDIKKNPCYVGRGRAIFGIVWGFIGLALTLLVAIISIGLASSD